VDGCALWKQWSARASSHQFFNRVAPRFGGRDRTAVEKAAFSYEQCGGKLEALGFMSWSHLESSRATASLSHTPMTSLRAGRIASSAPKASHWIEGSALMGRQGYCGTDEDYSLRTDASERRDLKSFLRFAGETGKGGEHLRRRGPSCSEPRSTMRA